jgi:hypothetical protein
MQADVSAGTQQLHFANFLCLQSGARASCIITFSQISDSTQTTQSSQSRRRTADTIIDNTQHTQRYFAMATKRKASMYNDEQTPSEPWASPSRQRARFDFAPESPEQEDGSVVSSRHSGIEPAEVTHSRTPSTAQEAPANAATQDRKQKFLQVVASNVSFRKNLRRAASSYNSYVRGCGYLKYAESGLVYYQNCIRNTEQDVNKPQAEMARLRLLNANQK